MARILHKCKIHPKEIDYAPGCRKCLKNNEQNQVFRKWLKSNRSQGVIVFLNK